MSADIKVVVVTRRTRLEELIARYHSAAQAKFYVEHLGADFSDYETEHAAYETALQAVREALSGCRVQRIDRAFLPSFLFGPEDRVVALGQDGLAANTLKYLAGQPLVGVNPDPSRYDGVLLPFVPADLPRVWREIVAGRRPVKRITMAQATLSDGQHLVAVNDLFVGPKSHTSARYEIELQAQREAQSSSGVIISTGLGSSAWMRSVWTGAAMLLQKKGHPLPTYTPVAWDAPYVNFAAREPFPSVSTQTSLVWGRADRESPLIIRSLMPENGVIFSDGIESDFLEFHSGVTATIGVADRVGLLVQ